MQRMTKATSAGAVSIGLAAALSLGCGDRPGSEVKRSTAARITAQAPVNPNASPKARQVLQLLYDLPSRSDKKVISGQTIHLWRPTAGR